MYTCTAHLSGGQGRTLFSSFDQSAEMGLINAIVFGKEWARFRWPVDSNKRDDYIRTESITPPQNCINWPNSERMEEIEERKEETEKAGAITVAK